MHTALRRRGRRWLLLLHPETVESRHPDPCPVQDIVPDIVPTLMAGESGSTAPLPCSSSQTAIPAGYHSDATFAPSVPPPGPSQQRAATASPPQPWRWPNRRWAGSCREGQRDPAARPRDGL